MPAHQCGAHFGFLCAPLQFPYRTLPVNPFLLPRRVSAETDFGSILSKSTLVLEQLDIYDFRSQARALFDSKISTLLRFQWVN
jgi:hypothetical protein